MNFKLFERVLDQKRNKLWMGTDNSEDFYNFYGYLKEYLKELELFLVEHAGSIKKDLVYTSIDRPGLIAEISAIHEKRDFNITEVSIRVNGEFATTKMQVSCQDKDECDEMLLEILKVDNVLKAELK